MKCLKCPKTGKISHFNGFFCPICYIDMINHRIKKDLRKGSCLSMNDRVLVHGKLAEFFLKKAVENLPIIIKQASEKHQKGFNKAVIQWSSDDEANLFLDELTCKNPVFEKLGCNDKIIKIFRTISDKELEKAAKILKIKFKPNKKSIEFEKIRKRQPVFGFVKTAEDFKKALK